MSFVPLTGAGSSTLVAPEVARPRVEPGPTELFGPRDPLRWPRRAVFLGTLLFVFLGVGVFDHDVWSPTEPTLAGVLAGMVKTGDLAIPRIHGLAYLEKPPLFYGLSWLCARIAGHLSAGVLRLPSAVFGAASLALVGWTTRRFHGEAVAWACTLVAATCFSLYEVFHRACTDSAAIFFAFLGFSIFAWSLHPDSACDPRRVRRSDLLLALALALSFYAKNFYTLLVVLPPIAVFLLRRRQGRRLLFLLLATGACLVLALAPWCLALYRAGGWPYLRIVFVDNTLGRFLDLREFGAGLQGPLNDAYTAEKDYSPFVYPGALLYLPLPWTPICAAALVRLFLSGSASGRGGELRSFLKYAWVTLPVVLTLSSSKVGLYLAPILWVDALALGEWLADPSPRRIDRVLLRTNLAIFWLLLLGVPVAAWSLWGDPWLLAPLLPIAGIGFAFALRRRRDLAAAARIGVHGAALAIGSALVLAALMPTGDESRSYRWFFEEIRPELDGRELCTALRDDLRLPLLDFYLDRPVERVASRWEAFEKLRGPKRVGVFLSAGDYQASRSDLADLSYRVLRGRRGKQAIVLVVNR
jgi:4-amino-4-deoxy-L-arabinose transferase-like glycosyltransferase